MELNKETESVQNKFPKKSAGRLMETNVPTVDKDETIGAVEDLLLKHEEFDSINYVYVVDKQRHLKGVISIKELFRQPKTRVLSEVMTINIITVRPHTHRERVAHTALKHNLKSVPVVDVDDIFLGVVPSDTILSTMYEETSEDILRLAGIQHPGSSIDNIINLPILKSVEHRIPWLFIGLFGGIAAAGIVSFFEDTLKENIILAAFIPLIVYMADAIGTQMEAFIIRDSAINPKFDFGKYFFKQTLVVSFIGVLMSGTLFVYSIITGSGNSIGGVLGIALFLAIISSVFTGLIIPYALSRFKFDPANASGPVATIIQDILSITIYFAIAAAVFR
ncbi:magnesium transporter [Candidatus Giovannonibacteria bacterium]|nr:magnesium transporter [Candidatus Giovannonibacteria bacterium]